MVLTCTVEDEVVDDYVWHLDGIVVGGQTVSTLEFDSYKSTDDGTYTCYADTSDVSNSVQLEAKQGMYIPLQRKSVIYIIFQQTL